MERRTAPETVADSIASAMKSNDVTESTLAEATGIAVTTLRDHFDHKSEFTWGEVTAVGGFLHVHPARFFEGVAA